MLIKRADPEVVSQYDEQTLTLITHDKTFHTDDCMGTAILLILFDSIETMNIELVRTRNEETIKEAHEDLMSIVYDVGNGYFDHHSPNLEKRVKSGIPYAASGLLWRTFGRAIISNFFNGVEWPLIHRIWNRVDNDVMEKIDNHDINGCPCTAVDAITIQNIINSFRHHWFEETDEGMELVQFIKASNLCKDFLTNKIFEIYGQMMATDLVRESMFKSDNDILFIPLGLPWIQSYFILGCKHELIVIPGNGTNWNIQAAPIDKKNSSLSVKELFPENYRGLKNLVLSAACGIDGMIFCSNNGHLAIAETKEAAMAFARKILKGKMEWPE